MIKKNDVAPYSNGTVSKIKGSSKAPFFKDICYATIPHIKGVEKLEIMFFLRLFLE